MRLWRLSSARRARELDGGYGIAYDGRWNTRGRPVTYCSTTPSLAALEKRVHVNDASLLPPQMMVELDVPDDLAIRSIDLADLPDDWAARTTRTQAVGNQWLDSGGEALLQIPSVIMPLRDAPDRNVLINHRHRTAVDRIRIAATTPFSLDPRLFI